MTTRLLAERMPEQVGCSIVHGDYRLGNMITNDGKVSAVLDWELCTLGDPLADVGYLLNSWVAPGEREEDLTPTSAGASAVAKPCRSDMPKVPVEIWRTLTITGLSHTGVWLPLIQGVYKRYLVGAMGEGHDVDLDAQKEGVFTLSEWALELLPDRSFSS